MKRSTWIDIISSLFILLFLYTAITKLFDLLHFRNVLYSSPLLHKIVPVVSLAIPITEIVISIFLFFPKTRRLGLWASLTLMLLFTGYITYMLYFSPALPCSCGGVISQMSWKQHLIFNSFFIILAAIGLFLNKKGNKLSGTGLKFSPTI